MARWTTQWFLSLYLFLIFVQGSEDADEAYKYGRNLVLEYFLPISAPVAVDVPLRREKRDVEGSGEDDAIFSELKEKSVEDADNSTQNAFAKLLVQEGQTNSVGSLISTEGSGEVDEASESSTISSEEEKGDSDVTTVTTEAEAFTGTESGEITGSTISENRTQVKTEDTSTEMIFDKSEDFVDVRVEATTTTATEPTPAVILDQTTMGNNEEVKTDLTGNFREENITELPESEQDNQSTPAPQQDSMTVKVPVTETATESPIEATTVTLNAVFQEAILENGGSPSPAETTTTIDGEETREITTPAPAQAVTVITTVVSREGVTEESSKTVISESNTFRTFKDTTKVAEVSSPKFLTSVPVPNATELFENVPTDPEPVMEEIFKESKVHKNLEALPGNILKKQNLSLAADPLLVTNTRLMDSEETVQLSSAEPKRLGAYVVIGLILLSFSSLVGYITFKKRMNRKRQEFEHNQESNDTEKALLSLSDYKDSSELEENHLKNNEITPIVVKSNTQINKFEKSTNFSSPKNLNMIANEKNIEKDNVLKSTAENLTQVIIEGSPKDMEDEKNVPNMEKLIVKTRIDQDSIPKKAIIINRSSTGYMPIPQDNA